jgi:hypothetical protein
MNKRKINIIILMEKDYLMRVIRNAKYFLEVILFEPHNFKKYRIFNLN